MKMTLNKAIESLTRLRQELPDGVTGDDVALGVSDSFGSLIPIYGVYFQLGWWDGVPSLVKVPIVDCADQRVDDSTPRAYAVEITGVMD